MIFELIVYHKDYNANIVDIIKNVRITVKIRHNTSKLNYSIDMIHNLFFAKLLGKKPIIGDNCIITIPIIVPCLMNSKYISCSVLEGVCINTFPHFTDILTDTFSMELGVKIANKVSTYFKALNSITFQLVECNRLANYYMKNNMISIHIGYYQYYYMQFLIFHFKYAGDNIFTEPINLNSIEILVNNNYKISFNAELDEIITTTMYGETFYGISLVESIKTKDEIRRMLKKGRFSRDSLCDCANLGYEMCDHDKDQSIASNLHNSTIRFHIDKEYGAKLKVQLAMFSNVDIIKLYL